MKLMKISEFRRTYYTERSRPAANVIRRRIDAGKIPGGFRDDDGRYMIDVDVFEESVGRQTNDPLLDRAKQEASNA